MRRGILLATLLAASSVHGQAQNPTGSQSAAAHVFAKSALVGMQLSLKHGEQRGEIPAAVSQCVQSLDDSTFDNVFNTALVENLSTLELQATNEFFGSPVGQKYAKQGLMQLYAQVGEQPPEPMPSFSDHEYKRLEAFSRTSAGSKLMVQRVLESPTVRATIGSEINVLLRRCRETQH